MAREFTKEQPTGDSSVVAVHFWAVTTLERCTGGTDNVNQTLNLSIDEEGGVALLILGILKEQL